MYEDEIEAGSLQDLRVLAVMQALTALHTRSVIDLGCGPGDLLEQLLDEPSLERIVGLDIAEEPLRLARARLPEDPRLSLILGSFTEPAPLLRGFDAAALIETIEHIDPGRLGQVEAAVFGFAQPSAVIVTTPNRDYNINYGLGPDEVRHPDHRFEWGRARFRKWADRIGERYGYRARITGIGDLDPGRGQPTQMAVFVVRAQSRGAR